MRPLLAAFLIGVPASARAQTAIVGDAWIIGPVMVGTTTTSNSRLNIAASSATGTAFQISGVDLAPLLRVGKDGKVGLSTTSSANVDVNGSGDSGNFALMVQSGNLYQSGTTRKQITFGQDGTSNRRHAIASTHSTDTAHGSIDFLIWSTDTGSAGTIATMTVVSLTTISSGTRTGSVHVRPVGEPAWELVVSNGSSLGGGTIHAAAQASPSSREWKRDISYIGADEEAHAYERERGLQHVSFRYAAMKRGKYVRNPREPLHRGLIYEDAPPEIRGPGETLSFDERLLDSEMAFQELARKLDAMKKEVAP